MIVGEAEVDEGSEIGKGVEVCNPVGIEAQGAQLMQVGQRIEIGDSIGKEVEVVEWVQIGEGGEIKPPCETPYARSLLQLRHPLRAIEARIGRCG